MNKKILFLMTLVPCLMLAEESNPKIGVFGLSQDILKKFTIPADKYWSGGLWGLFGYKPSPTRVDTFRDYLLAKERIKKNIKDAQHSDRSIARNTYVLAMAIQCNPELQKNMQKCVHDYEEHRDVEAFEKCFNVSRDIYMRTVNQSFDAMNAAARTARETRYLITADAQGAECYETKNSDNLPELRKRALEVYRNGSQFAKTGTWLPMETMDFLSNWHSISKGNTSKK